MASVDPNAPGWSWRGPVLVFCCVLAAQLWLVRQAGTDIPYYDQWSIEGKWLYPAWQEGRFGFTDVFKGFNENRIVWTVVLDLAMYSANGNRWDPLLQITVASVIRAACAMFLARLLCRGLTARGRAFVVAGVSVGFLPFLAWHNALWGIESHAYFVLGFTIATLALLAPMQRSWRCTVAGIATGIAALLAMSPGALIPPVLIGLTMFRAAERRAFDRSLWTGGWPALLLFAIAVLLRVPVQQHESLKASGAMEFILAAGRALAWPHVGQPLAAIVMNAPLVFALATRLARKRKASKWEDFVLLLGGWGVAIAFAIAWARGGSDELAAGIPSRYVDFLVVLPIANTWLAVILAAAASAQYRWWARAAATTWCLFAAIGWIGLSAETLRNIIIPRIRDRDAPIRVAVAFQQTGDPHIFVGQPRLLVPHPDPSIVTAVLRDPLLRGALPPSFQPDKPMGPLSRSARALLFR